MSRTHSEAAIAFLQSVANPDGGWGYQVGGTSSVEPTCAALMTLSGGEAAGARARAFDWLIAAQNPDGGWGLTADDEQSGWQTAWALLVLAQEPERSRAASRGAAWLLSVELASLDSDDSQRVTRDVLGMDPNLVGWPWLPGQASFVEPTALALLALHHAGQTFHSRLGNARAYLLDRRCQGGGWNVGNPRMFSEYLPPRASATAFALLALDSISPSDILPGDVAALRLEMSREASASALALGLIALRALDEDDATGASTLASLQDADGSWGASPFETALAVTALRGALR